MPQADVRVHRLLPLRWWGIWDPGRQIWHLTEIIKQSVTQMAQLSSFQSLRRFRLFATPWTAACQASCPSPTPRVYLNSCPLSWWCHPTISSSVIPLSSHLQSFPASGSFPMSQFFKAGGQSIGVSASASVLSMNIQDWFPLGWTGWISLQSKGLSRVFSTPQFKIIKSSYDKSRQHIKKKRH